LEAIACARYERFSVEVIASIGGADRVFGGVGFGGVVVGEIGGRRCRRN